MTHPAFFATGCTSVGACWYPIDSGQWKDVIEGPIIDTNFGALGDTARNDALACKDMTMKSYVQMHSGMLSAQPGVRL